MERREGGGGILKSKKSKIHVLVFFPSTRAMKGSGKPRRLELKRSSSTVDSEPSTSMFSDSDDDDDDDDDDEDYDVESVRSKRSARKQKETKKEQNEKDASKKSTSV